MTAAPTRARHLPKTQLLREAEEYRLHGALGVLTWTARSRVVELLRRARHPLADDPDLAIHLGIDWGTGARVYWLNGEPVSLQAEASTPHGRIRARMRRAIREDIKAHREAAFTAGPVHSALSGVELVNDATTHVDHHPRKFCEIADEFLGWCELTHSPDPDTWTDWSDWVEFHRRSVGWLMPGVADGLRFLTAEENLKLR